MQTLLHLQTVFPSLLTFTFFAPFVLRVFVGGLFICDFKNYWRKSERWWVPDGIAGVIGILLVAGYGTQVMAILGIGYLAFVYYKKDHESLLSNKTTALLALAILISLLVTGGGALAFDLPY